MTYLYSSGCEGAKQINIRKYNKKTGKLFPIDHRSINVIKEYHIKPSTNKRKKAHIVVLDKRGRSIKYARFFAISDAEDSIYNTYLKDGITLKMAYVELVANRDGYIELTTDQLDTYKYLELAAEVGISEKHIKFFCKDIKGKRLNIITNMDASILSGIESIEWVELKSVQIHFMTHGLLYSNRVLLRQ